MFRGDVELREVGSRKVSVDFGGVVLRVTIEPSMRSEDMIRALNTEYKKRYPEASDLNKSNVRIIIAGRDRQLKDDLTLKGQDAFNHVGHCAVDFHMVPRLTSSPVAVPVTTLATPVSVITAKKGVVPAATPAATAATPAITPVATAAATAAMPAITPVATAAATAAMPVITPIATTTTPVATVATPMLASAATETTSSNSSYGTRFFSNEVKSVDVKIQDLTGKSYFITIRQHMKLSDMMTELNIEYKKQNPKTTGILDQDNLRIILAGVGKQLNAEYTLEEQGVFDYLAKNRHNIDFMMIFRLSTAFKPEPSRCVIS